ncbi:MAG: PAS domain S-box protein [Nitrospira sp.]|nr:PAS domain S-box protein [Nitrospira sp.]
MKKLQDLRMVMKLAVIAGMFMVIVMLCGLLSIWGLYKTSQQAETIYKVNLLPVRDLGDLRALVYKMVGMIGLHVQAYDSASVTNAEEAISTTDKEMDVLLARYAPSIATEADREIFEEFKGNWSKFKEVREKVLQLSRLFSKDAAGELRMKELIPIREALLAKAKTLIDTNEQQAEESYQGSQALSTQLTLAMTGVFVILSMIGLAVVWLIAKIITKNLTNVLTAAEAISSGNLAARATVTTQDEVGQLAEAFNRMAGSLETAAVNQVKALEAQAAEISGVTTAISRSQAVVEFNMDGTVITANENFLRCFGYELREVEGKHHRMFCDPAHTNRGEYIELWRKLGRGEYESGVYPRRRKNGQDMWIQASYNPIVNVEGKVQRVVEYATDITGQKVAAIESEGLLRAVERGQAVIEFSLDGTVRNANAMFLDLTGYRLDEIKGRHHRMFCDVEYSGSGEYTAFWNKLNQGEFDAGPIVDGVKAVKRSGFKPPTTPSST